MVYRKSCNVIAVVKYKSLLSLVTYSPSIKDKIASSVANQIAEFVVECSLVSRDGNEK